VEVLPTHGGLLVGMLVNYWRVGHLNPLIFGRDFMNNLILPWCALPTPAVPKMLGSPQVSFVGQNVGNTLIPPGGFAWTWYTLPIKKISYLRAGMA
jgi:hypothetical protein